MSQIGFRFESRVPGRYDLTASIRRDWRPDSVRGPYSRHFRVYLAFLPVVREWCGARGYRWRRAWIFGRHGSGRGNLHLGPIGFVWTE